MSMGRALRKNSRDDFPATLDLLSLFDAFGVHSPAGEEEMKARREKEDRAGKTKKRRRPIHCRVRIIK
jgi:hypothetical protein